MNFSLAANVIMEKEKMKDIILSYIKESDPDARLKTLINHPDIEGFCTVSNGLLEMYYIMGTHEINQKNKILRVIASPNHCIAYPKCCCGGINVVVNHCRV